MIWFCMCVCVEGGSFSLQRNWKDIQSYIHRELWSIHFWSKKCNKDLAWTKAESKGSTNIWFKQDSLLTCRHERSYYFNSCDPITFRNGNILLWYFLACLSSTKLHFKITIGFTPSDYALCCFLPLQETSSQGTNIRQEGRAVQGKCRVKHGQSYIPASFFLMTQWRLIAILRVQS